MFMNNNILLMNVPHEIFQNEKYYDEKNPFRFIASGRSGSKFRPNKKLENGKIGCKNGWKQDWYENKRQCWWTQNTEHRESMHMYTQKKCKRKSIEIPKISKHVLYTRCTRCVCIFTHTGFMHTSSSNYTICIYIYALTTKIVHRSSRIWTKHINRNGPEHLHKSVFSRIFYLKH